MSTAVRLIARYPELAAVLVAAVIGLTAAPPLAWLAAHQAINVLLAVLVFATAVTIEPAALRRLASSWPLALAVVVIGITVLPALSWAVSRVVAPGMLRDGVMTVGLAPCEIASVATTAMAGGEAVLAAGVLIGSVIATVGVAGSILSLEPGPGAAHAAVNPAQIAASLALVVALPLAAGLVLRARLHLVARAERVATMTATGAVVALVAVIAAEVHLSARYLPVALALVLFLAGSAAVGWLLGCLGCLGVPDGAARRPPAVAALLTTSMRDFAIAAAIAAAAFGPAAAAPLGLYGILVLAWGTGLAGFLRRRRKR